MHAYQGVPKKKNVSIGGKTVVVDSQLEERMLRWLEAHGYKDKWERHEEGISIWKYNYTPDVELCVSLGGMAHRAIVEIKPEKSFFFEGTISKRMRKTARYYHSDVLLLYADKEKQWYRIDRRTGKLTKIVLPPPGDRPINRLYKPISLPRRKIYAHRYRKKFNPWLLILKVVADILEVIFKGFT